MINYNLTGNKNSLLINYLYLYLLTGEDCWGGGSWWQRGARKAHFVSFYFLSYHAACWILFSGAEHACRWSLNHWTAREVPKKGTLWMVHYSLHNICFTFGRVCDYLVLNIAQKNIFSSKLWVNLVVLQNAKIMHMWSKILPPQFSYREQFWIHQKCEVHICSFDILWLWTVVSIDECVFAWNGFKI